jgi:hypothetical protein
VESHTVKDWSQVKPTESREVKDIEFGNISTCDNVRIAAYLSPADSFLIC